MTELVTIFGSSKLYDPATDIGSGDGRLTALGVDVGKFSA